MRRCGSGRAAGLAQNLRGAEGRCDSVRVFCEACNAHKSCAEHRAHLPKAYLSAVDGEVVGQQSKGGAILAQSALLGPEVGAGGGG